MATLQDRTHVERLTITIRPDQRQALRDLVVKELKHGNQSRYIQDLIDADLAERAKASQREAIAS